MSEQEQPQRPPTSGPGSGASAWRAYAAAVTGSPVESWEASSREEIVALLDREGVAGAGPETAPATPRRKRPVWMVPTADGFVPERDLPER